MESFFDKLGGRKSAMSLLVVLLGTAVESLKPGGLSESYVMLLVGVVGIFSGANALVSWKGLSVGNQDGQPASEATAGDEANVKADVLAAEVEQLKAEVKVQAEALNTATQVLTQLMSVRK